MLHLIITSDNKQHDYQLEGSRVYELVYFHWMPISKIELFKKHSPDSKVLIQDKGKTIEECILSDIFNL